MGLDVTTAVLPPPINFQGLTQNGSLNAFGFVATYAAGTTTPLATYTDSTQSTPNPNPVPLNAIGQAAIWLAPGTAYKFVETDQFGNQCGYADNINASGAGITSNLVPSINNVLNIGSPTFQWANGYFGGSLYINGISVFTQQTAAEATAGVTPINLQYPPMSVDRYATNTTPGTTDMSGAFNKAVYVAMIAGGEVTYGLSAPYLLAAPINCTFGTTANQWGIRIRNLCGTTIDPANQTLIFKHTASAAFDCTGNDNITFQDFSATTDPSTFPQTGILLARAVMAGNNSQMSRLFNPRVLGKFSVSNYYNYGSEDSVIVGGYFWNTNAGVPNTATRTYTGNNIKSIASAFSADPFGNPLSIRTGSQSCIDHNAFGCQDNNQGGTPTSDCVYLEQTDSYKSYGGWAYSGGNGRSLVYVDLTNAASNFCVIDGLTGESAGFQQTNGILFSNNAQIPAHFSVKGCKLNATTAGLAAGALVTLDDFTYIGNSCPAGGIAITGILQNSDFDYGNETTTVINNSTRNRLTGDTGQLTVTTRINDFWIDTGTTNKTIAAVPTTGISSSSGGIVARARLSLDGPCLIFQVLLASGSGNLTIAAGSTLILTAPGGQALLLGDSGVCTVTQQIAGISIGAEVTNSGNSILITIPNAVGATPNNVVVNGTVFVA